MGNTASSLTDTRPALIEPPGNGWRCRSGSDFVVHLDRARDTRQEFAEAVARGLEDRPRRFDSRYLYDDRGSMIFERITEQPEYYPTRTEEQLLATHAGEIREHVGDATVVELGSGSSLKTRRILSEWCRRGSSRYVPIDISAGMLEAACRELATDFPDLIIEGIAASYERALPLIGAVSPVHVLFLGSTIGNLEPAEMDDFLSTIVGSLRPGDTMLLGIDLVKDVATLEAAYNDAAGWTAKFTTNLFTRMNREIGTDVPLDAVEHVAFYNAQFERIEIYARFREEVTLAVEPIGRRFQISAGEMIRTEICRKFRTSTVAATVAKFGFTLERVFSDPDDAFALLLLRLK